MPRPYALKDADVPDKTAHEIEINESSQLQGNELLSSSSAHLSKIEEQAREESAMADPQGLPEDDERTKSQIAAMIEAERDALARRRRELESCDCKAGMFPDPGRRRALFAAGS